MRFANKNGAILWRGPSRLDGKPIVVIATGLTRKTDNSKTGDMIQTWILRSRTNPLKAINNGGDYSICGDCSLRGIIERAKNIHRVCYVSVKNAPYQVYEAYKRGSYSTNWPDVSGRMVRLGAYGDPAAAPYWLWRALLSKAAGHTGYTHQWRQPKNWRYRRILMASCETDLDAQQARAKGWRTFTVSDSPGEGEVSCPAEYGWTCADCGACDGAGNNPQRVSITIPAHGSPAILSNYQRLQGVNQ